MVDGHAVAFERSGGVAAGNGRMQFRYTGIDLSAPDRVQYSYRLEGLDRDWVQRRCLAA